MLDFLRKKRNYKIAMFLIAVLIIPAFILWGVGTTLRMRRNIGYAGRIFSRKISINDYLKNYRAVYNQALLIFGRNISQIAKYLNLERQTWDRLILLYEAKRRKIKVSDKEVAEWIRNSALFQKDGKFDKKSYEYIIKYFLGTNVREFEEMVRDNLKIKKLIDQIHAKVTIDDKELWERYRAMHESFKISYILIRPLSFYDKVQYSEEEIKEYYQNNRELFKKPEEVNVEYILIPIEEIASKIKIKESEIKEYWEKNKDKFKEENLSEELKEKIKQSLAREKARQEAEDKIWLIKDELDKEDDFNKVAQKHNVQFKETGFFSPREPIPGIGWSFKFTQTAFSLAKGKISEPIELALGFCILRIKERKPPHIPEFAEVKDNVETKLKEKKAKEIAEKYSRELLDQIKQGLKKGKSFEEIIKEMGKKIRTTEFITENSYLAGVGPAQKIIANIRSIKEGEILDKVLTTSGGFLIVKLEQHKEAERKKFEADIKNLRQKFLRQKQEKFFQQWFQDLEQRANLEIYNVNIKR